MSAFEIGTVLEPTAEQKEEMTAAQEKLHLALLAYAEETRKMDRIKADLLRPATMLKTPVQLSFPLSQKLWRSIRTIRPSIGISTPALGSLPAKPDSHYSVGNIAVTGYYCWWAAYISLRYA
jgi:hypothetical protein